MPPKGTKRAADGSWVPASVVGVATPQPKKPRSTMSSKTSCGAKLSPADAALLHVPTVRKELNDFVKQLAKTVDDDWHDSYEETGEMLFEWLQSCAEHVSNVLRVGLTRGVGFEKCHEVLKIVVDTWSNINAIPFRGCPAESLQEGEAVDFEIPGEEESLEIHSAEELVKYTWPLLLARAAADGSMGDEVLQRMIKDSSDHGVQLEQAFEEEAVPADLQQVMQTGRARVCKLVAGGEWKSLPSSLKVHRMRRAIDRRFDGPLHRRTRDPAMFEDFF
eukprot:TRINITY_DN51369_c0_g1_i1.p1 TRINITY_DN51369_c0_g1~~TRINITY_DN51369_c0_g1_i1.p1  ORF type:complete len:295 (+),score=77.29 TRINITY_DN51369_c0_g1_i1:58-885(+)